MGAAHSPSLCVRVMMAGINIAFILLVVFLAGEVKSTLDSHCTDISYFDAVQYTTSAKQCCKPQLQEFCENKSEEVCKDVVEVQCEPKARAECRTETSFAEGKKCSVELQHYDYKDCNKKVTTRIDCKQETVQSCKPKVKLDQDGSPTFNGDLSCTPLIYEKCVVVDDAVSGCSKQELDSLCACGDEASSPVCAGGLLYDNKCKYECKKKRDQCAFPSREFPAVEDIKECVSQDAKGIVNRDKIKEFKEVLRDIEEELEKLASSRSRRDISQFSDAEYELLNSLVKAKEYVRDHCSTENGQCDVTKLQTLIEKSKSTFKEVKESGSVSPGYVQTFAREKEQFEEVAVVAEKVQETLAAKPKQPDCTCSEFTNNNGIGKCQHRVKIGDAIAFGGQVACYVNEPTSCSDVIPSESNPGKYLSAEACSCSNVSPNNPVAYESCGQIQIGRSTSNQFENVRLPGRAADSPTCTTPFQVKWADYTETAKAMTTQETVCEVKKSVECKRVSVNKCTVLDWEECSWRPVQQCEPVFVSEPSQEKVHQKKCLNTGSSSSGSGSSSSTSASSGSRFSPHLSLEDQGSYYYGGGQG